MYVRKLFQPSAVGGESTEYWETAWAGENLQVEPVLARLLADHLPPRSLVLEAGCGSSVFVGYLDGLGHTTIGVDLARRALARAKADDPALRLAVGDVGRLPCPDAAFDAVTSLGVIEHAETGPALMLAEQHRVLAPKGTLFLTVPRISLYRRATDLWNLRLRRRDSYMQRGRAVTRVPYPRLGPGPGAFHQYEFAASALLTLVQDAGFDVVHHQPWGVASGVGDVPRLTSLVASARTPDAEHAAPVETRETASHSWRSQLSRVTVREQVEGPIGNAMMRVSQATFGHLELVVAVKR